MLRGSDLWTPWTAGARRGGFAVYCFPWAGGGASGFRGLAEAALNAGVTLHPIEYPGHESRFGEAPAPSLELLAEAIVEDLAPTWAGTNFAFLGHSFGAKVAFRAAQLLEGKGLPGPKTVLLSAAFPPGSWPAEPLSILADAPLLQRLASLGGLARVGAEDELLRLMLPTIRSDLALAEAWTPSDRRPLRANVVGLAGAADAFAPPAAVRCWEKFAAGGFALRVFEGGHFFLDANGPEILALCRLEQEDFARETPSHE
ncbi:thioesterase II family protein [Methylocapsa aurea]|uniref:thioesterase II family protein n=1 Tax=Methylocapsa aurea TaxID=663610 RepID=UPI00056544F7|nr:alpha/beta fold hydrolase [Methylocapsa aurea]